MFNEQQKARIKWTCRRGMLELDVVIMPFFEECFDELSAQQQQDFVSLLECDDPDLFRWIMKQQRSDNPAYAELVDKMIAHNLKRHNK